MDETRLASSRLTTTSSVTHGRYSDDKTTVTDTSFDAMNHLEKAAYLNKLWVLTPTEAENSATDVGYTAPTGMEYVLNRNGKYKNLASPSHKAKPQRTNSKAYIEIMRAQYVEEILQALRKVQSHARTTSASVYIDKILHTIQQLEEKSPVDPFLELLFAFYESLAFDGLWATYTTDQYQIAERVLASLVNQPINTQKIEKAIAALDSAGFDTLPYSFTLGDEDE